MYLLFEISTFLIALATLIVTIFDFKIRKYDFKYEIECFHISTKDNIIPLKLSIINNATTPVNITNIELVNPVSKVINSKFPYLYFKNVNFEYLDCYKNQSLQFPIFCQAYEGIAGCVFFECPEYYEQNVPTHLTLEFSTTHNKVFRKKLLLPYDSYQYRVIKNNLKQENLQKLFDKSHSFFYHYSYYSTFH